MDTFTVARQSGSIKLGSTFIAEASETLFVGNKMLPRDDYSIDYMRGLVLLKARIPPGSRLTVKYVEVPLFLRSLYSLRRLKYAEAVEPSPGGEVVLKRAEKKEQPDRNLIFGGMKSISFAMGSNQGVSLDQTLKATITGDIAPGIRVNAMLSDENLPIQPQGNTEELEYLDKVFVEIASDHAKVTMGDFKVANRYSSFSPLAREVRGVSGEMEFKRTKFLAGGTTNKGIFKTVTFRGTEGLQGPYELLSQARVTREVILAGSEKVYLDGELLRRGKNRDYTIDYDGGTITFTPKRLITADSEIAVDYEVSQENFDRTGFFAGIDKKGLPGKLEFQAFFAMERDNVDRPKSLSLSEEEKRAIADAGDEPGSALGSGVRVVEAGRGNYVLVPADTVSMIPAHYEYDDSTGTFVLAFVEVAVGEGDYVLDGISERGEPKYKFVGVGGGNYIVGKRLPLPRSHGVLTTRISRGGEGRLKLELEYNMSDYDLNTLSSLDDGDNVGDAGSFNIGLERLSVGPGFFSITADLSTVSDKFKSFGKVRPWYFYRDWNLEKVKLEGRESISEVSAAYGRQGRYNLEYSLGRIERSSVSGLRNQGKLLYKVSGDRLMRSRMFRTAVDGNGSRITRTHQTHSLQAGIWRILPSVLYSEEEYLKNSEVESDSGIAYRLYKFSLSSRGKRSFSWRLAYASRDTREVSDTSNGWFRSRRNQTYSFSLASQSGRSARGELQLTHRVEEDYMFGGKESFDLARVKGTIDLRRLALRNDLDYEISQNQARTLQKNVIFVGEGKGDYNELGEPVGKGKGSYMLVFIPTTLLVPTHKVDFTWRMLLGKGSGGGKPASFYQWLRANVSLDQTLSIREETTYDESWKVYLLFPSALQRDASTLSGITSLRQDWSFLEAYKNLSLILRYQRIDEEENRYQGIHEDRFFSEHALKMDRSLSGKFSLGMEAKRETRKREGEGISSASGGRYNVNGYSLSVRGGIRLSPGSTTNITVSFENRKDEISGSSEKLALLKMDTMARLLKVVSIYGTYDFTMAFEKAGFSAKPIFFNNEGDSHRWSITANVQLSRIISLVATYSGRSEKSFLGNRIVEHNLRLETRAYF